MGGVQLVRAYSGNYVRGDAEKVGLLPLDACWEAEQTAAHAVAFDQFAKGAAKMYCPVATTDELVRAIGGCRPCVHLQPCRRGGRAAGSRPPLLGRCRRIGGGGGRDQQRDDKRERFQRSHNGVALPITSCASVAPK